MAEVTVQARLDRERVLAIAGDLLDEHGLDAFTMTDVAERAGVTQPALYRHVDNAADLWRGLALATRDELQEALRSAILGRAGTDAVCAVSHAWRSYALQHPGRYRSTERAPVAGDPELERALGGVLNVIESSLRGFDLDSGACARGALMIRSVLHGFVSFELGGSNAGDLDADDAFTDVINMMCAGLDAL